MQALAPGLGPDDAPDEEASDFLTGEIAATREQLNQLRAELDGAAAESETEQVRGGRQ
jgi:hypothetical protein